MSGLNIKAQKCLVNSYNIIIVIVTKLIMLVYTRLTLKKKNIFENSILLCDVMEKKNVEFFEYFCIIPCWIEFKN